MILASETRVNTYRNGEQTEPDTALLADGSYVTVWQSQGQDGSGWGVYFQRFSALGVAVGPEVRANASTLSNQTSPRVAALSNGGFVVSWDDDSGADGAGQGLLGQLYSGTGSPVGGNLVLTATTAGTQQYSDVASYAGAGAVAAGFVAVWSSPDSPGSNGWDIFLQRYDNGGTRIGSETRVSALPASPNTAPASTQITPRVAAFPNGDLVIVWRDDAANDGGATYGVFGRKYIAATNSFTTPFQANTFFAGNQYEQDVAVLADGGFVVVWRSDSQDGSSAGVYGQRFDSAGAKVDGEFLVNQSTTGGQYQPSVTGLSVGGFVVAWYNDNYDVSATGTTSDVYVREYSAAGLPLTGQQKLASLTNSTESQPHVTDLGAGKYVVTYTDNTAISGTGSDIVQQISGPAGSLVTPQPPVLGNFSGSVTFAENLVNATPQPIAPAVGLSDVDSADFDGGRLDLFFVQGGAASDQLGVRSVGTGPNQISVAGNAVLFQGTAFGTFSGGANGSNLVVDFNANATLDAVEALVQSLTYASTSQSPATSRTVGIRIADGDGASSASSTRVINVTPESDGAALLHGEETVNSYTANDQQQPEVAVLTDGSYVVTWQSYDQDSGPNIANTYGIYFQRFSPQGVALGGEYRVNTVRESTQESPHIAALSNGGFVIIWDDAAGVDGSGQGVIGQIYSGSGTPVGGNFVLNPSTANTQQYSDVAAYAGAGAVAAGFAAVWSSPNSPGSNGWDIFLQRYDNNGARVGTETVVSALPATPGVVSPGTQILPRVSAFPNGDLVIVWRDDSANDGGGSFGVFGRKYIAATNSFTTPFQANTYFVGNQYEQDVAVLADGGFVVVWRSDSQDGSSAGVYGQRFDAAGAKAGGEFLVNETIAGGQYQPSVTALSTGGFVVSFYNDNYDLTGTGTTSDAYIREYDASGNPVDGQRKLASPSNSGESQAVVGDLGGGSFVVVYTDYATAASGGNNTNDIVQQLFGPAGALPRQGDPVVGDFSTAVTFLENSVNAGLQPIDTTVSIDDADSANFAGGQVHLYFLRGAQATDQLGVRHQGNAAGQIGVAGNTVSFGGTAIGSTSGGSNGSELIITLQATATRDAVQALVQNLGYASTSQSPITTRDLALRISDGDGGATSAQVVTITVTPQLDGAPLAYDETQVNTYTPANQLEPEVARLADGGYVVVWQSAGQDGSGEGAYAQRYTSAGTAVGPEVRLNTTVGGGQEYVHVAGLKGAGGGGYVVVWQDASGNDTSGYGVFAQRYDAAGAAVGPQTVVNTFTSGSQYHGVVDSYDGGYAVVYSSNGNAGGDNHDIYLKRYANDGTLATAETRVSTLTAAPGTAQTGQQELPDVAAYANGNLVIVWQDYSGLDGNGYGVFGRLYTAATNSFTPTFRVNNSTVGQQHEPSVATLADGGFVVVWRNDSYDGSSAAVLGQRYSAAGAPVGSEFLVNETIPGGQYQPAVTGLSTGGFVVTFYNDNYDVSGTGTTGDVYIREYDALGDPIDGQRKLGSVSNSTEFQPAVADLGGGSFVVIYSDYDNGPGGNSTYEVQQQIFGSAASLARQASPELGDFTGTVTFAENVVNAAPRVLDASVSLTDIDSPNFDGGRLDLFFVQGSAATDQLSVRNVGTGAGQIGFSGGNVTFGGTLIGTVVPGQDGVDGRNLQINLNAAATVKAVETLVQNLAYANTSQSPETTRVVGIRVSDGDGGSSASSTVTINVTRDADGTATAYGEAQVNTFVSNNQVDPEMAVLTDGSYVVVWTSDVQDGSTGGVYGQRFNASGVPQGNEFKVNTMTSGQQDYPHVAALSNGGFVVVWQDSTSDAGGYGVYGQRYDATGTPQGSNVLLPAFTGNSQYHGAVAGYTGGYAVVWTSTTNPSGNGFDIYLRRFDNAGTAQSASDLRVSDAVGGATPQAGSQELPDVAAYANGNLVIVWQDSGNALDGSGYGVFGRLYNATTGTFGGTFAVNTNTSGNQYEPKVATLADGGFVVVWRDDAYDGSSAAVLGQRYDAAGIKTGGEFQINETAVGGQYQAAVTGLSTGGFVITFYNDNYDFTATGTTSDVYIREYNAAGQPVDGQFKLPSVSNSTEFLPAIADLRNGNFVVAYTDLDNGPGGNGSYEIKQQIFGDTAELPRPSANPLLDDLKASLTLSSAAANALNPSTPQLIDSDLQVVDSDSANFDGGVLSASFLSGALAADTLGVRNVGNGAGQVGVAGTVVSYGGIAVGTLQAGTATVPLTVTFNASATAAAVQAVAENLVYGNAAIAAGSTSSRTVGLRLSDGDGGSSEARTVVITVQPSVSLPTLLLDDVEPSVTLTETQARAGALVDAAVSLDYTGATGFNNGRLTVTYQSSTNRSDDQLSIRNQGTGADQVSVSGTDVLYAGVSIGTLSTTSNGVNGNNIDIVLKTAATAQAIERVVENLLYTNTSQAPLASRSFTVNVTDGAGVSGTARSITLGITPEADPVALAKLGDERQVNTFEPGEQTSPAVAVLKGANAGAYVITWVSETGQDGSAHGVFAQRFNANGSAQGPEFQVNTRTLSNQTTPALSGLADGGFVVAWRADTQDGSGSFGVYAQRYGADGSPQGAEFRANTTITSNQYEPAVLGLSDGSFIVAYRSDYSDALATYPNDVLAQRFTAAGAPLGTEITLNSSGGATQYQPQLATLSGGGFVAIWTDTSGDASGSGIGAQIFSNAGAKLGALINVNTTTPGEQTAPDVVGLSGGGFVAVWESGNTVLAQLFTAAGAKVGGEITVNTVDSPSNQSNYARVAALGNGGFVVTWDGGPSASLGGSSQDVAIQQFDASGNKVDGVRLVNTTLPSTQYLPDIVGLSGNNAVVAWAGYAQEASNSSYGVFQQLLGTPGSISASAAPVLVDVAPSITFNENAVNAAPQLLDPGVSLSDSDSANFDGGRLWVSVISGYGTVEAAQASEAPQAQDSLGLRSLGDAPGQVNVVGSQVRFGGTAIGTVQSNGQAGADLVLLFNASATPAAVEAVIESLTYSNSSSTPVGSRTLSISVSDGDGGTSVPRTVVVNVTPEVDGAQALYGNDRVNTYGADTQERPDSAKLSDGGYVTVWVSQGQDGWSRGVYVQRFDSQGVAVGAEFRANTNTVQDQYEPAVAGLTGGGYVVTWRSDSQDGSGAGVYAQRFSTDGIAQGAEFRVNTTTSNSQYQPHVVGTTDGGFVIAFYSDNTGDSFFQRYNAAGVVQGVESPLNPAGQAGAQADPTLAALPGGGFIGVWQDNTSDGSGNGIYAQRFTAGGAPSGAAFRVNTYSLGEQVLPEVAVLNDGGWVITWSSDSQDGSSYGVYAQRYDSAGATVGGEFRVNTSVSGNQSTASVVALSHGGFAVSWYADNRTLVQQFDAAGARIDGELRADAQSNNAGVNTLVPLANGGFMVSWSDYDYGDGSTYNIYQQLFGAPASFVRQANPNLVDLVASVTFEENAVNAAPQVLDAAIGLSDADSPNFDGGTLEVNYLTGYSLQSQLGLSGLSAQDQLSVRNQGNGPGQVGVVGSSVRVAGVEVGTITSNGVDGAKLTVLFNANATVQAVERVIENLSYANTFSDPAAARTVSVRVTDGDGGASAARTVVINVTPTFDGAQPLFDNDIVNTYQPSTQTAADMALLADGSYVTVWTSEGGQDGWEAGVYGQRYSAQGAPLGTEFQIHSYTPFAQTESTVIGLSGGGFVVAWRSQNQDGSGAGVYAQRFNTEGVPQGTEFRVNSGASSNQYLPSMAATADGGFVVGWYTEAQTATSEFYDVLFQRYNASGVVQGGETRANLTGEGSSAQYSPALAGLPGGGFVAVWTDNTKDGSGEGIYGQRFTAGGAPTGPQFRANSTTVSTQNDPQVAVLSGGGFVVTWTSSGQDSSGEGIFAQRYDASGNVAGTEFRVNTTVSGAQYQSTVTPLSNGGFVVAWNNNSTTFVQQFDANGVRVDGELRADTHDANNNASVPSVLGLASGAFVVAWTDYDYTDATYQVFQQLFGSPASIVRQANPELVDVNPSVTLGENLINAVPQLLDSGVGLIDTDSANFDGGTLEVNYITGYGAQDQLGLQGLDNQDQLGIRSVGTGDRQISVVGTTVSFGGTAFGSIVSNGANGSKLTVSLNANATPDAVEQLVESLTYANNVSNPIASRTVSIRVTDGDGGASVPRNITINVTPENDGAVKFGSEKTVNTTVAGNQFQPDVATLSSGGYVVVWEDQGGADGSSYGVYGQRYDVDNNPVGGQFRANSFTNSTQYDAQVVGLSTGGYVVAWRSDSQDTSGAGVYAQRYNPDGTVAGSEFRVNSTTNSNQYQPTLAATSDGGFVVAWYHDSTTTTVTDNYEVFFQRYNASGAPQGTEVRATPPIAGQPFAVQSQPSLAWLQDADGGFVVAWTDNVRDGNSDGVFVQRYTATGTAEGGVQQVNTTVDNSQQVPAVAALKDGGFVVTWTSEAQDLSSTGIYAQRFDASGARSGTEFRVNTSITGQQYQPSVTALENGGWAISWADTSIGASDIFVQQYDVAGRAVDGETLVNTYRYSNQQQPALSGTADGGFVVAYAGVIASGDGDGSGAPDGGNDTYEIRLQRFSNTAPVVTNVNVTGQEEAVITLPNTLFESGFADPEGQSLQAVKIVELPAEGALRLNGVAVLPNQEIGLADLQAGLLTYQGRVDYFGNDQFRWTGSDGIAFATTPVFTNIVLSNVNDGPRLGVLSNASTTEGTTYSRALVIADPDPEGHLVTVNWGDGTAPQVFTTSANAPGISHTYAENQTYTVTVTANDQQGQANSIEVQTFTMTVANAAPTISLSGVNSLTQGDTYSLTLGQPFDPANTVVANTDTVDQYTINWGDGSALEVYTPATLPASRVVTHVFTTPGVKTVTVALRDEDGSYASAGTRSVTVAEPAEVITVSAGNDVNAIEGTSFTQTINLVDPTDQGAPGRTYTVVWGDGTPNTTGNLGAGATQFNISHIYADNGGPYDVLVTVNDDGVVTQQGSDTFVVTVANQAPTVGISAAGSVNEGSLYTVTLNPFDPGSDTITQYVVSWGDGSAAETYNAGNPLPANRQLTHTYADGNANFTIRVDVTDEDGVFVSAGQSAVFVANVAPTAPVTGADTVDEGSFYTLTVGSVTDPGADARTGYSINWGDGTSVDNFTPAQWSAAQAAGGQFQHRFADGGSGGTGRTVTVTAVDDDGSFVLGTKTITVANLAPSLSLSGPASLNETQIYSLAIAATDPAGAADGLSFSVNWGDGSAPETYTAAQLAAQATAGTLTHTYLDDADGSENSTPRTITVVVDDGDGGVTTRTLSLAVNNVAPTAAVSGANSVNETAPYVLSVGPVLDPGLDTRTGYSIDWGDGSSSSFTPAEWAAAAGSFIHPYADGGASVTITVRATDEDGTFVLGTQAVNVLNVAPQLGIGGAASSAEGASYALTIAASDIAGAADPLSYSIDWGDGQVQTLSAAQFAALPQAGVVTHVYADDEDGPTNATPRTISVTVNDGDGGSDTKTQVFTINNVAPTAPVTGNNTANEGAAYTLTVGAITDPGADTRTGYTINWGDGDTSNFTPTQWATAAGSFTHTYADGANNRSITVSATDEDGTFVLGTQAVTVQNVAPTLGISGAASSNEGAGYVLSLSGSDPALGADPLTYSITWGDGSAVQTVTAAELAAAGGSVAHTFLDDEDGPINATPRTVSVTVNDGDGGSDTKTQVVTVNNVAPTIALGGGNAAQIGTPYTLNLGAITDPGTDTVSSYRITWGDGSAVQVVTAAQAAAAGGNVPHTYAAAGAFTVAVALVDEDGTFDAAGTQAVTVSAQTPTVAIEAGADASLNEGATFTRSITFSDGEDNGAPGWTYSIDYGDGVIATGNTLVKTLDLNHVYADGNASHVVTVTVSDTDPLPQAQIRQGNLVGGPVGESASDSFTVTVNNVAPAATVGGNNSVNEGAAYTLTVGAITDPGADTRTGYTINWGDGDTSSFTPAQWAAAAGSFTHTYADGANNRSITVSATDEDGTFVLGTKAVAVENVAPTLSLSGAASSNEGAGYVLSLSATDPALGADPLVYSISWGDGSAVQTVTAAELAAAGGNVGHTFLDDEDGPTNATPRTISVTVNDGDGGSDTKTQVVTVNNVAPVAAVTGNNTANEGAAYTLTVGAITDPGADTRTGYTINWGDGDTSNFTPTQWATAAGSFTHTYADGANNRSITVSATDEDGTFVLGTQAVTVQNVAPTLGISGAASSNEGAGYVLSLSASDPALGADPLTYSITWGDGSAVQTVTAVELAAAGGNIAHTFVDDEDGPSNATPRTISVTVNDGDGGTDTKTQVVTVNNVAPTIALGGGNAAQIGTPYTLNLGAVTDPGTDTVSSYRITWGDGSAVQVVTAAQAAAAGGNVPHTYAAAGAFTVAVALVDEDGTFDAAGTQAVTVSAQTPTVAIEAGADASLNEGATFTRSITFSDGEDNGAPGWAYSIDYGDGVIATGNTLVKTLDLNHVYADGPASQQVTVTVSDGAGATLETASDSFTVSVANVAPATTLSGAATANEGAGYLLGVGSVVDPGADTRTGYSINWGDGLISNFTALQWQDAAGSFAHTYAEGGNGGTARTITVSATDEDGTFVLASKDITVANVAPAVVLSGNASTNEGATYSLTLTGSDAGGVNDPLSYLVDWGDGTATQTFTSAQLSTTSGVITHVFADDENGPVNSTLRTVRVTVSDDDGGSSQQTLGVNVNNVAPSIALGGTGTATAGQAYTLNLGAITDPGQDTVTSWLVNWGDGSPQQAYAAGGNVTHVYAGAGTPTISVGLVDEDGTFNNVATQPVVVTVQTTETVTIGNAPGRLTSAVPSPWVVAWTNSNLTLTHKADADNTLTPWTPVTLTNLNPNVLSGGDVTSGDLGVSGQSLATAVAPQEIEGSEGLRVELSRPALNATINFTALNLNDDGLGFKESGRVQAFDGNGALVAESVFAAGNAAGTGSVNIAAPGGFLSLVITSGAYNGQTFVDGGYQAAGGGFGSQPFTQGLRLHGSDFLVDAVTVSLVAQPLSGLAAQYDLDPVTAMLGVAYATAF